VTRARDRCSPQVTQTYPPLTQSRSPSPVHAVRFTQSAVLAPRDRLIWAAATKTAVAKVQTSTKRAEGEGEQRSTRTEQKSDGGCAGRGGEYSVWEVGVGICCGKLLREGRCGKSVREVGAGSRCGKVAVESSRWDLGAPVEGGTRNGLGLRRKGTSSSAVRRVRANLPHPGTPGESARVVSAP
jgi:hypothetical protein